jgi:hypothetical protein
MWKDKKVATENLYLICMVRLVKDGSLDKLNTKHVKECLDKQLSIEAWREL